MNICGIVCEYNPLHSGHLYQINKIRERLGQDTVIVCCMSGNFVQRGQMALLPKHERAKMAVLAGASLVLELPSEYALSSAERFARGAVYLLLQAGITHLSFGAEDADGRLLMDIAGILLEKQTVDKTRELMEGGIAYAVARERALFARVKEKSEIISRPNNILAVEYCKALLHFGSSVSILPIGRQGAQHDGAPGGGFASASFIRGELERGNISSAAAYLPAFSAEIVQNAMRDGLLLKDTERLECAMLAHLVRMNERDFAQLPDAREGLEHRLLAAVGKGRSIAEICDLAKTKRYAMSRIRRMLMCAYLGITADECSRPPRYMRILALDSEGGRLLRPLQRQEERAMPIITKPGDFEALLAGESLRTDLYNLALPAYTSIFRGEEFRKSAFYLR